MLLAQLALCGNAQDYIGDKRKKVKASLEEYMRKTNVSAVMQETDTTLLLPLNDPNYKPVDFTFLFDKEGKCTTEIRSGCDTCVAKYLQQALEKKTYEWKQTGSNRFMSNSRYRLQMELLDSEKGSMLLIRKLFLSRNEYNRLLRKE